jgi:hypothetical protein
MSLGVEIPTPKTRNQAKRLFSNDKIKNFTKLKLQEYLESFFTKGYNQSLLGAVSPRFIHYNTSRSFDPKVDPTQRRLQIARYFNELRNVIPSILIIDGGINPIAQSIGLISDASINGQTWRGYFPILRAIPIAIIAAARDMDEADEMSGIISLMFNELRNIAGGSYICGKWEEGENWAINLPNAPVEIGPLSEIAIEGDPLEKIWYTEATLEVIFQDMLAIKEEIPAVDFGGVYVNNSDLSQTLKPVIIVPDRVPINQQQIVMVQNFQDHYRIVLSDSNIATLSYTMKLTPRRFGKVSIQIIDTHHLHINSGIIATKEVEIV